MPAELAPPELGEELRARVRTHVALALGPEVTNPFSAVPGRLDLIRDEVEAALRANNGDGPPDPDTVSWLMDELVGLGPLQRHIDDPAVTDVLVNRWDEVYVEREGVLRLTATRFRDQAHLEQVIQKIVALVGREISIEKPLVDARMVDGSRANAVYAPVGGPSLSIRKFNHLKMDLEDWVATRGMSPAMARFLELMAACRANLLISGATGAGKSTLLRSIVSVFPADERVITIEDTAELDLDNPHWVKLECVHSNSLGEGGTGERRLDVADLVQNALRMRPDRLIVGEIRHSKEAFFTLEALNTGHDGSATTIHASGCADALARLELLVTREFPSLSPREVRGYVARVFNVLIHVSRLRNGVRCVTEIVELAGCDDNGGYLLRPVFTTRVDAVDGRLEPVFETDAGYAPEPRILRRLEVEGLRWTS